MASYGSPKSRLSASQVLPKGFLKQTWRYSRDSYGLPKGCRKVSSRSPRDLLMVANKPPEGFLKSPPEVFVRVASGSPNEGIRAA